jgi:hypothetical protein
VPQRAYPASLSRRSTRISQLLAPTSMDLVLARMSSTRTSSRSPVKHVHGLQLHLHLHLQSNLVTTLKSLPLVLSYIRSYFPHLPILRISVHRTTDISIEDGRGRTEPETVRVQTKYERACTFEEQEEPLHISLWMHCYALFNAVVFGKDAGEYEYAYYAPKLVSKDINTTTSPFHIPVPHPRSTSPFHITVTDLYLFFLDGPDLRSGTDIVCKQV